MRNQLEQITFRVLCQYHWENMRRPSQLYVLFQSDWIAEGWEKEVVPKLSCNKLRKWNRTVSLS